MKAMLCLLSVALFLSTICGCSRESDSVALVASRADVPNKNPALVAPHADVPNKTTDSQAIDEELCKDPIEVARSGYHDLHTKVQFASSKAVDEVMEDLVNVAKMQEAGDLTGAAKRAKTCIAKVDHVLAKWSEFKKLSTALEARRQELSLSIDNTATLRKLLLGHTTERVDKLSADFASENKYGQGLVCWLYANDMIFLRDCSKKLRSMLEKEQAAFDTALVAAQKAGEDESLDVHNDWLWDRVADTQQRLNATLELVNSRTKVAEPFLAERTRLIKEAGITDERDESKRVDEIERTVAEKFLKKLDKN